VIADHSLGELTAFVVSTLRLGPFGDFDLVVAFTVDTGRNLLVRRARLPLRPCGVSKTTGLAGLHDGSWLRDNAWLRDSARLCDRSRLRDNGRLTDASWLSWLAWDRLSLALRELPLSGGLTLFLPRRARLCARRSIGRVLGQRYGDE